MENTGKHTDRKTSNSERRTGKKIKWDETRTVCVKAREVLSQERHLNGRRDSRGQRYWEGDQAPEVPQAAGVVRAEWTRRDVRAPGQSRGHRDAQARAWNLF